MKQRTIAKSIELVGIGLHKGVPVRMILEPLPENSGIVFYRSDLGVSIPLKIENVIDTTMATVIGKSGAKISTIEHLLSAINAYGIDNLRIVLDNEEAPIMDGSSIGFCMLLEEAGIVELNANKKAIAIKEPIEVAENGKFVRLEPSDSMIFDFSIKFPHRAIMEQSYKFTFSTQKYKDEIARARTFGFVQEVNALRAMGLGLGGSLDNCIVLDENGVMNKDGLRYKDEFVRHKILDAIGDMSLLGMPIMGGYFSFAGSHKLNHFLTKKLMASSNAYEIVELGETALEKEKALATSFAN
ncbi:UDP-3-O-acyl-N-acetylglucosamine deacetylase [Helicobacter saguini]|uniref:UDP-3-O-acyl-N-acetylglucosamine deacetylase n=1 Tax=Helicobacter saguini TaxID=1548018 RepID=A0A347VMW5_9HELI|nr:UDP-3-O-acyl-N-acetylglucosamine deacetylase [Helicobacter saguini]MWV61996.1 UDP-3-O-acyl-N-acetylglucosamine deacetylase [Helicobacter saguini]MWV67330.1 UDP-3-O-acyl-N-acetylglucosamine deacetylase [Helicobacter saguini]MWV69682.1 UDP-3-O-acyl-N-acetylglucosamine deacetylase [Helicobacter saguini]MWV73101.1 UDP-3-O-acyl-N-acetylglucosamine deacetylase [Helicobacter saguini]TLD95530.1 UDP-3-O-acyl-N-acetylglucosamine deacetylase [Helicobacter saguini]